MTTASFVATVKEREKGQPCSVWIELDDDIGLGKKTIIFDLPAGTDISHAETFARALNAGPRPKARLA